MTLVGYLSFFDAPKQTAKESVAALKRLKVAPKILTGDQAAIVGVCCSSGGHLCRDCADRCKNWMK